MLYSTRIDGNLRDRSEIPQAKTGFKPILPVTKLPWLMSKLHFDILYRGWQAQSDPPSVSVKPAS